MDLTNLDLAATPQKRGERLRLLRKLSGSTIHKMAQKYDIGSSTIKYWENGRGVGLSIRGANSIIAIMRQETINCLFAWLMYGIGTAPPDH